MPLYKRPGSPYWWIRLGKKTRVSTRTADREEAKEFETTLRQRQWRTEQLGDRGGTSWDEVAERWLNCDAKQKRADRDWLKWLKPEIGHHPIRDVANIDVLENLRKLALKEGKAKSTVDRMMSTVGAVLNAAVDWQILTIALPTIPMYRPTQEEPRFLTPDQFELLCGALPRHLELAARFAVHTLLRMRAMTKLTWERVDLSQRIARIPAAQQKEKRPFGFALNDEAIAALKRLRQFQAEQYTEHLRRCKRKGIPLNARWDREHVFTFRGKRIDNCNTRAFQAAVEAAGVAPLRWHQLRHTGASWAIQSGVQLKELMELGDWKDIRSVLRYAHLSPGNKLSVAQKVAQFSHTARTGQKPRIAENA